MTQNLTDLQLELLKVYAFNPTEEELLEIKQLLASYFAKKLTNNVQQAIDTQGITHEDLESWLNEKS